MRYIAIVLLATQQYFAISILYAAIPVILRKNGASLELVGLTGMAFFAFTVNFLWAPFVDRYSIGPFGLRKSWLVGMQFLSAMGIAGLAVIDPTTEFVAIFSIAMVIAALVATQRIATLGYIAEALETQKRPFAMALFGWGGAVGNVIGGAVCLYLIDRVGWQATMSGYAAVILAFALSVLPIREPDVADRRVKTFPVFVTLKRPRIWLVAASIVPGVFGLAVAFAMLVPRLVDFKLPISNIGLIIALGNVLAFTLVAPLAGILVSRKAPVQGALVTCVVLATCFTIVPGAAFIGVDVLVISIVAVGLVFSALAAQHVAFNTWFLSVADPREAATDVTFLTSVMSAVAIAGFAASGFVAQAFGYDMTLTFAAAGYALSAIIIALQLARWKRKRDDAYETDQPSAFQVQEP